MRGCGSVKMETTVLEQQFLKKKGLLFQNTHPVVGLTYVHISVFTLVIAWKHLIFLSSHFFFKVKVNFHLFHEVSA